MVRHKEVLWGCNPLCMRRCADEQGRVSVLSVLGSVYITGSMMAAGKIGIKIDRTGKTFLVEFAACEDRRFCRRPPSDSARPRRPNLHSNHRRSVSNNRQKNLYDTFRRKCITDLIQLIGLARPKFDV